MTVRVNLLPREIHEREVRRRQIAALVAAGLVLVAALGGVYFVQLGRVAAAEERLAAAEAERQQLQGEADELGDYATLAGRRDSSVQLVKAAMAGASSLAGVMQDVAAVMPTDAALTDLSVTVDETATAPQTFDFGGPSYGKVTGAGETRSGHAPGVERFLLHFEKIAAFFNVFVSSSTVDEDGYSTFNFEADLGPEVQTGTHVDGVPEVLR